MELRPHHLLCVQKFTGHGYSEAFTAHMCALVLALADSPETTITVKQGCDALCKRCPNRRDQVCTSLEKVARMDQAVLSLCGLAYGETIPWNEASSRARERILETEVLHSVCGDCQWFALCEQTEGSNE